MFAKPCQRSISLLSSSQFRSVYQRNEIHLSASDGDATVKNCGAIDQNEIQNAMMTMKSVKKTSGDRDDEDCRDENCGVASRDDDATDQNEIQSGGDETMKMKMKKTCRDPCSSSLSSPSSKGQFRSALTCRCSLPPSLSPSLFTLLLRRLSRLSYSSPL